MQMRVLYIPRPHQKIKVLPMFFVVFKLGFGDNNIQRFKHLFNFKNRREKIFVNVEQAKGHYTFVDKHENFEALKK